MRHGGVEESKHAKQTSRQASVRARSSAGKRRLWHACGTAWRVQGRGDQGGGKAATTARRRRHQRRAVAQRRHFASSSSSARAAAAASSFDKLPSGRAYGARARARARRRCGPARSARPADGGTTTEPCAALVITVRGVRVRFASNAHSTAAPAAAAAHLPVGDDVAHGGLRCLCSARSAGSGTGTAESNAAGGDC
eukprot:366501-Chlamydomonas_euryale.AAC.29